MTFAEYVELLGMYGREVDYLETDYKGCWTDEDELVVNYSVDLDGDWTPCRLRAKGFRAFCLGNETFNPCGLEANHPLLWSEGPRASIAFRGFPRDLNALLVRVYEVEEELLGDWSDTLDWQFRPRRAILGGGYGTIHYGPLPLIEAYLPLLREAGIDADITGLHPGRRSTEEVLLTDDGYIVAETFVFEEFVRASGTPKGDKRGTGRSPV